MLFHPLAVLPAAGVINVSLQELGCRPHWNVVGKQQWHPFQEPGSWLFITINQLEDIFPQGAWCVRVPLQTGHSKWCLGAGSSVLLQDVQDQLIDGHIRWHGRHLLQMDAQQDCSNHSFGAFLQAVHTQFLQSGRNGNGPLIHGAGLELLPISFCQVIG